MDWKVLYTIEKLLIRRCLKWDCMTHLDIWNTSYGQKKGRESNWQFDFRPLKVENWPNFLACRWRAKYCWKTLNKGYNFSLDLISIRGLQTKLWGPKVVGVATLAISKLPFGSLETKCHLDVGLAERHKVYYKGEGGGFPQLRAVVWVRVCPCLRVDNYLHFLIVVINDIVDAKIIREQIFKKMKLVASIHENVQFNVEQAQKKQKKTYATRKGKQTFERLVIRLIMVKMKKPGRKKALTLSWEGP